MSKIIHNLSEVVNYITSKIAVIIFTLLTVLTTLGVVYRYVLQSPIIWLYELSMVLFVWMVFLGVAIGFKKREHIKLEFIYQIASKKAVKIMKTIVNIFIIIFVLLSIKIGIDIIEKTVAQYYNTIDLSIAWFYGALPVCAVVMLIHMIDRLIIDFKE